MYRDQPLLTVDLGAIVQNWRTLEARTSGDIGATVKANGYGLGVGPVATALAKAGCETFFVATLQEGLALRDIVPKASIYVFSGVSAEDIPSFKDAQLLPVLNSLEELKTWAQASPHTGAAIHIDTGINRLGFSPGDTALLRNAPELLGQAKVTTLMSHLACADTPDHDANNAQRAHFHDLKTTFPALRTSLNNSAGTLNEVSNSDLARPGIGLYGGNPRPALEMQLRSVVTLTAPLLQCRTIEAGESVGYGATFVADKSMTIATVGIGYGDGIFRSIAPHARLYVEGAACPVLGRISMDSLVIDVSPIGPLPRGMRAELLGRTSVNDMARWAGTISYEVLTSLGQRLDRRYIEA